MDSNHEEAEVVIDESRRDRRGRVLLSEERWNELLAGYEKSGQSQKQYCREAGINVHTFVARLAKQRRGCLATGGVAVPSGFVEAKLPAPMLGSQLLEVLLPNGLLLRGTDPTALGALLRSVAFTS